MEGISIAACIAECRDKEVGCSGAAYYPSRCYLWASPLEGDLHADAVHQDVSLIVLAAQLMAGGGGGGVSTPPAPSAPAGERADGGSAASESSSAVSTSGSDGTSTGGSSSYGGDSSASSDSSSSSDGASASGTGMNDMPHSTTTMAMDSMATSMHATNGTSTTMDGGEKTTRTESTASLAVSSGSRVLAAITFAALCPGVVFLL